MIIFPNLIEGPGLISPLEDGALEIEDILVPSLRQLLRQFGAPPAHRAVAHDCLLIPEAIFQPISDTFSPPPSHPKPLGWLASLSAP